MEDKLKEIYQKMYQYMISGNTMALSEMMCDDFTLTHMTGERQNRNQYMEYIRKGILCYFSETTDSIDIKSTENTAMLIGRSRVESSVYGGGKHTWRLQLELDMCNMGGRWLIRAITASTY